jgi:hypothetical protein
VAKLANARDLKSLGGNPLRVRASPRASRSSNNLDAPSGELVTPVTLRAVSVPNSETSCQGLVPSVHPIAGPSCGSQRGPVRGDSPRSHARHRGQRAVRYPSRPSAGVAAPPRHFASCSRSTPGTCARGDYRRSTKPGRAGRYVRVHAPPRVLIWTLMCSRCTTFHVAFGTYAARHLSASSCLRACS